MKKVCCKRTQKIRQIRTAKLGKCRWLALRRLLCGQSNWELRVSKGGFLWGGGISIIGVACAPLAIINFASNPCANLWVYIGFNKQLPHKKKCKFNYCNRHRGRNPNLRFWPPQKKPLETPKSLRLELARIAAACGGMAVTVSSCSCPKGWPHGMHTRLRGDTVSECLRWLILSLSLSPSIREWDAQPAASVGPGLLPRNLRSRRDCNKRDLQTHHTDWEWLGLPIISEAQKVWQWNSMAMIVAKFGWAFWPFCLKTPHFHVWTDLELFRIVRANDRLNFTIPILFGFLIIVNLAQLSTANAGNVQKHM